MTSRCDSGAAAGFTLIELIVVMAIISMALSLLTFRGTPVSPATHARISADTLAATLRTARSAAVMSNQTTQMAINVARRTYRFGPAPGALPGDVSIALLTTQNDVMGPSSGNIIFYPDGSSSGGRIAVTGGTRTWFVGIDWLSGQVSVAEKSR